MNLEPKWLSSVSIGIRQERAVSQCGKRAMIGCIQVAPAVWSRSSEKEYILAVLPKISIQKAHVASGVSTEASITHDNLNLDAKQS